MWGVQHVQFFGVQTFPRSFTVKLFPHCLIMKTYLFFLGPMLSKFLVERSFMWSGPATGQMT